MEILEKIKTTKTLLGKSQITSGNKYKVKISYNGKSVYMIFHDNFKNGSDKKDFVYSLMQDANAYRDCYNFADFMNNFNYTEEKEVQKIYNACRRQSQKFDKLFTEEEQEELQELLADY